ncbi:MAG: DUF3488 domain-containing protein [Armatimonadetes bacterium]|nr:DUF3488 domain-containing protein [Armatimonadota bacterium]
MNLFRGWLEFLKRDTKPPEHSVPMRLSVACGVLIALVCTSRQLEWPTYTLAAIVLTAGGFLFSYRFRQRNNWELKAILSVLMLITLINFFGDLGRMMYDPRIPLAGLIVWLQTLHSWDVPARRDLNYSAVVGLILMALSAVLSYDMIYGLYLLAFLASGLVTLHLNHMALLTQETGTVPRAARVVPRFSRRSHRGKGSAPTLLRAGLAALLLGLTVFLMLPRTEGMRLRTLPVSWQMRLRLPKISDGEIMNPSYPSSSTDLNSNPLPFSPDNYFGFNSVVDLNLRGRLNSEVVMKVRTTRWSYYRGLAFDRYTGRFWSLSDSELEEVNNASPPLTLPFVHRGTRENVQIYHVERTLPNVVFAAPAPRQLYFPSEEIYLDTEAGVRSPFALEQGMIYSVVSYESELSLRQVMRLPARDPYVRKLDRYLELPGPYPGRVKELAGRLVQKQQSTYGKAAAISIFLKENYRYELEPPPYPREADTADYFLFKARVGYCEQFATAMVVLCRAAGLHARYVTGYLPGNYNPLTGFYEVRGDQAHAWVEVYVPNLGWVTFDPTPEGPVSPDFEPRESDRWLLAAVLKYLAAKLGLDRVDFSVWLQELYAGWSAAWSRLGVSPAAALAGLWTLAIAGLLFLLRGVFRRRRPRARRPETPTERVFFEYRRALALLAARGFPRLETETPREYNRRVQAQRELPELAGLTALFEGLRYSPVEAPPDAAARSEGLVRALRERLRGPAGGP